MKPKFAKSVPSSVISSGSRNHCGFTLVELLVVIVIIAILATVGLTSARKMTLNANKTRSMGNLRQIVTVNQTFSSENNGAILHEMKTVIDGRQRMWAEVLLDVVAPEGASLNASQRTILAKELGLFGDKQALKLGKGKLPATGASSWRTYAYNNQIGSFVPDAPGGHGWVGGPRYTHQVVKPEKLMLYTQLKLQGASYPLQLQGGDLTSDRIEFDLYGGVAIVGFFDGHVETFPKANFPLSGGKDPQTGSPYTQNQLREYMWSRTDRIVN